MRSMDLTNIHVRRFVYESTMMETEMTRHLRMRKKLFDRAQVSW